LAHRVSRYRLACAFTWSLGPVKRCLHSRSGPNVTFVYIISALSLPPLSDCPYLYLKQERHACFICLIHLLMIVFLKKGYSAQIYLLSLQTVRASAVHCLLIWLKQTAEEYKFARSLFWMTLEAVQHPQKRGAKLKEQDEVVILKWLMQNLVHHPAIQSKAS
jgi:hypothetical protein